MKEKKIMTYDRIVRMALGLACGVSLAAVCGCGGESSPVEGPYRPTVQNPDASNPPMAGIARSIGKMADTDIIVWVDGSALTKKDFDDAVNAVRFQIAKYKGNTKPQQLNSIYNLMCRRIVGDFVNEQLLVHEARNRKFLTQEQLDKKFDAAKADFAKACEMKPKLLAKAYPGGQRAMGRMVENMVWKKEILSAVPIPEVSAATVSNLIAGLKADNLAIQASNELQRAALKKLREQIVSTKADFEAMARIHSKCPFRQDGEKGNWGSFGRDDFRQDFFNDELGEAIFKLKPGEISDVQEDGEGYSIVKFVGFDDRDEKLAEAKRDRVFSRIFLPKQPFYLVENFASMEKSLKMQVKGQAIEDFVNDLKKKAKIVYPHGEDFFGDEKKAKKQAAKAVKQTAAKKAKPVDAKPAKKGAAKKAKKGASAK